MADTHSYLGIRVKAEDSYLSQLIRTELETNSSTFNDGAPLVLTSGLITEAASPVLTATIVGFARRDGQNGTSKVAEYIMAVPGLLLFANFLNNTNPDTTTNAIAAADKGTDFEIQKDTGMTQDGGSAEWHVADVSSSNDVVKMVSFESDFVAPNVSSAGRVAVGDLNARVLFQLLNDALAITAT